MTPTSSPSQNTAKGIEADGGEIGGCSITNGVLQIKNANADGITAKNVNITGKVTADDGAIGGWTIHDGYLEGLSHYKRADESNSTHQKVRLSPAGIEIWRADSFDSFKTQPSTVVTWMQLIWTVANHHGQFASWELLD